MLLLLLLMLELILQESRLVVVGKRVEPILLLLSILAVGCGLGSCHCSGSLCG